MANLNESQQDLMTLYGAQCAAVVGYNSGMLQGKIGSGVALLLTAAGHRSGARQDKTMKSLCLSDSIEDILIPQG